jgi:TonB family protein
MKRLPLILVLCSLALLSSAPALAGWSNKKELAARIEADCGLKKGTIAVKGDAFLIQPSPDEPNDHMRCALTRLDKHALDTPGLAPPPDGSGSPPKPLFSRDDYPTEARANRWQGKVVADLTISAEGRVTACTIVQSSGHAVLDQKTCDILRSRATFKPARGANGRPVEDHIRTPPIAWIL